MASVVAAAGSGRGGACGGGVGFGIIMACRRGYDMSWELTLKRCHANNSTDSIGTD